MSKIRTVLGFDMETDIGSWTSFYDGFRIGTPRILEILDRRGVTGTFFFTADSAQKNPDMVKMVKNAGHEIGCHTLFHETIGDSLFEIPGMIPILPEEVEHRIELCTQIVEPKAPEGWNIKKSSSVNPRFFNKQIATASPIANVAVVLAVGAAGRSCRFDWDSRQ